PSIEILRADRRRSNDKPFALFDIDRTHVIVVVGRRKAADVPFFPCPMRRMPFSGAILRTGLRPCARDIKDNRISFFIEIYISDIYISLFTVIIVYQRGIVDYTEWQLHGLAIYSLPGLTKIIRL